MGSSSCCDILSHHTLILPFVMEKFTGPISPPDLFLSHKKTNGAPLWRRETHPPSETYDEFVFFHPAARKALFPNISTNPPGSTLICNLDGEAELELTIDPDSNSIKFGVQSIRLHLFQDRIGLLALEFTHSPTDPRKKTLDQINQINDLARRIYPPFINGKGVDIPKGCHQLPQNIRLKFPGFDHGEDFSSFSPDQIYSGPFIGGHISPLLQPPGAGKPPIRLIPLMDDRMFTICWTGSDQECQKIEKNTWETHPYWYKYIHVDGNGLSCPNPKMMARQIAESTYTRWYSPQPKEYKTLYGISPYSFVCLTPEDNFSRDHTQKHVHGHYTRLCILALAQRTGILYFSNRIADISNRLGQSEDPGKNLALDEIETLYRDYIQFKSSLCITEPTPQIQGIELNEFIVRQMGLKTAMAQLQRDMKDLYEYANLSRNQSRNSHMETLTFLGAIFLPLSTAAALTAILPLGWTSLFHFLLGLAILTPAAFFTMKWYTRKARESYGEAMDKISLKGVRELIRDMICSIPKPPGKP